MAIALSGSQRVTNAGLVLSASMEIPFGVGDNRLLTVGVFQRNNTLRSASVTVGGSTLNLIVTADNTVPTNKLRSQAFFLPTTPTTSCTLTASFDGTTLAEVQASWWTGVNSSPLDIFNGTSGCSNTPSITASTPSQDNSMVFGALIHDNPAPASSISASVIFNNDNGAWGTDTVYVVQTTAASQLIDFNAQANDYWALGYAVFKSASSTNASPTIATNTASGATFGTLTPTLEFTGDDTDGDSLVYEIEIASNDDMAASGTRLVDGISSSTYNGGGGLHSNGMSFLTWQGHYQVDDRFGISFLGGGGILNKVSAWLTSDASLTNGYTLARIYSHQGTFGVDGTPLDPASASNTPTPDWLAKSASYYFDASSLAASVSGDQWHDYIFSGSDQIRLQHGTPYFVIFDWIPLTPDYDNLLELSNIDSSSFAGNSYIDGYSKANNGVRTDFDFAFRVYEDGILLSKSSASHAGFLNTVTASDTSPFTPGNKVSYTVQSGEELDTPATYFWRVRATDVEGSGATTAWTTPISFDISGISLVVSGGTHAISSDNVILDVPTTDVDLVIADSTHSHSADALTLAIENNLVIADSTHSHTADALVVTQTYTITVADSTHSHTADALTLTQTHVLSVADATHSHTADNVVLTFIGTDNLVTADALHSHTADSLALTQVHRISVADALHGHSADALSLTQSGPLAISDTAHTHAADTLVLTQTHVLAISDATHAHLADSTALQTEGTNNLVVSDSLHSHTADTLSLTQIHRLAVADSAHAHTADTLTLGQIVPLSVSDSAHGHTADSVSLTQIHRIISQDSLHSHLADNVILTTEGTNSLSISDAIHAVLSDTINLFQINALAISSALHAHTADALSLSADISLSINDALHSLSSDAIAFSQTHRLSVAEATHAILSDNILLGTISAIANVSVADFALYLASLSDIAVTQTTLEEL